jgi:peptidoglycan hydrolase-like protein with peptidoglycan-binding domain
MSRRFLPPAAILAVLVVLATVPNASAKSKDGAALAPMGVSLSASASVVDFGDAVKLTATTDPPTAGESVEIRDASDAVVASRVTGAQGSIHVSLEPDANVTLHARWQGLDSAPLTVEVRARVTAHLAPVRLFDTVRATGHVHPLRVGDPVTVTLLHAGRKLATRVVTIKAGGKFTASFQVTLAGVYRARARFTAADLAKGTGTSAGRKTPLPSLGLGDHGVFVRLLEQRLRDLAYHLVGLDAHFDFRTADAVMAFRKVQGLPRNSSVTASTWLSLASPRRLHPRGNKHDFHIEVNQSKQVLYTVQDGEVEAIIHVSTGKPSTPTNDGVFHVLRKIAGFSPHQLYYPSFFDGNRAIHGWTEVPTYAASHGCVRVPYWTAKWIYGLATIGTTVKVYHSH